MESWTTFTVSYIITCVIFDDTMGSETEVHSSRLHPNSLRSYDYVSHIHIYSVIMLPIKLFELSEQVIQTCCKSFTLYTMLTKNNITFIHTFYPDNPVVLSHNFTINFYIT